VAQLQEGKNLALVSDAGMPSISDPGLELVQACISANITVVPIPGVSACTTALVASGLVTHSFIFAGFLATDSQPRRSQLEQLALETRTIIIYEAPHRLLRTLQDLSQYLSPDRQICLGRELTKLHEEFWRGNLIEAIAHYTDHAPRGEFTLVMAGILNKTQVWTERQLKSELEALIAEGVSRSQASRQLAELTNLPRRQIYQLALTINSEAES
jgi:16S rRNA (cytidine1402-2'-O)-methyltransferase